MTSCIDACERAFASYSTGAAELPSVIHLDVPEAKGEIHVKAGHLHGAPYYAVKVASGFYASDPAAIDGLVMVFDAADGAPVAFLLDGGYITDLRTGAAGGVAAKHLAPEHVDVVAVIGTGGQARQQLDALSKVRPGFTEVRVWGRSATKAEAAVERPANRYSALTEKVVVAGIRAERRRRRRRRDHLHCFATAAGVCRHARAGCARDSGRIRRRRQAGARPGDPSPSRPARRRLARSSVRPSASCSMRSTRSTRRSSSGTICAGAADGSHQRRAV